MTATLTTPSIAFEHADVRVESRTDLRVWLGTCAIIAGLFLALQNVYWIPGGDSEVYVASAKNIAIGQGYLFNGSAARIAPPGWPIVLAAVMKYVSPTFLALKSVTLLSMLGALSVYFFVLRRFVSPRVASMLVIATALVSHVYSLTFWLHSDALFTLITATTVLLALQLNEGRSMAWRVALLLILCAAAAAVRWAAVINVVLIAGALLSGEKQRDEKTWLTAGAVVIVTAMSFFAMRWCVNHFAPPRVPFEASAQMDQAAVLTDTSVGEGSEAKESTYLPTAGRGRSGYGTRFVGFGTWFSYLLWQPFRLAGGFNSVWWLATAVGWVVAAFVIAAAVSDARQRRYLMLATLLYALALDLNWPQATARYLVPATPLLLLAIVRGADVLKRLGRASVDLAPLWQRGLVHALLLCGFATVVLCNATLYATDVWVMRSKHFADRYEAGLDKGLIACAQYLSEARAGNWQVCINPEYQNIGKRRMSPTGVRMLTMLTGKATLQLPTKFTTGDHKLPRDREFREWIGKNRVSYYLEQPPISPWRVWHFRMGWLQERMTGEHAQDTRAGWKLYRCIGRQIPELVAVPELKSWPTRVPGL